ncbi:MAG: DNA repair protein RecN [Pseudomonadales bacterium]|nr:DNA repair protein RecN [Pseudomonadales bacterium]
MLTHIQIRNFAIIDELDLEIPPNLSVITGETGAGKSIVLDALSLAMGQRADAGAVRHGCDKADILASFELEHSPLAQQWLKDRDLESDHDCILRRVVSKDGRSRGFINGRSSPLQDLKDLGSLLINIHGQHEHQALLKKETHRRLLDNFSGNDALLKQTATLYKQWHEKRIYLNNLKTHFAENSDRAELLHYQVQELETLNLQEGELKDLETEHKRLANAEKNQESCQSSLAILSDSASQNNSSPSDAITDQLSLAIRFLEQCTPQDDVLKQSIDMINSAYIQIEEAADTLKHYLDSFDADPARYQELDQRLSIIYQLARKHKTTAAQLVALHQQLAQELDTLSGGDEKLEALADECATLHKKYVEIASKLSTKRANSAKKLSKAIGEQISRLGMPKGKCQVTLVPLDADNDSSQGISPQGMETVEFLVTTNAGQPLKPLTKVASGGELSRISLAIQVICAEQSELGTIVFDEVDVGIGGGIAEVVGKLLRHLGKDAQVLCVTHLPQVAAQGHHHLHVNKQTKKKLTHTRITSLSNDEKVLEIARMLGGLEITDQTIAHAKEMVTSA